MSDTVKKGISGSTVKLVAVITMFIDHFAAALLVRAILSDGYSDTLYSTYFSMRMIGRLGFPIFCFLLVEGFGKTRSKAKYAMRLGMFALISEIPFDLAFSARVLEFGNQNVFFTLFLGLLSLCGYDYLTKHKLPAAVRWLMGAVGLALIWVWQMYQYMQILCAGLVCLAVLAGLVLYGWKKGLDGALTAGQDLAVLIVCMALANLLQTDYSAMGVLTITVMYILRSSRLKSMTGGCVVLTLMSLNEITAFFALIPTALYNGERGMKLKYFFYAFYPMHLLLLWLIAFLMGTGWIPVI